MKIANVIRVLCSDAVQDPRESERFVSSDDVFLPSVLENTKRRTSRERLKITTIEQLHTTGCVGLSRDINIIVVEGGTDRISFERRKTMCIDSAEPKQQKKIRRLLLHRIKWNASNKNQVDEGEEKVMKEKLIFVGLF